MELKMLHRIVPILSPLPLHRLELQPLLVELLPTLRQRRLQNRCFLDPFNFLSLLRRCTLHLRLLDFDLLLLQAFFVVLCSDFSLLAIVYLPRLLGLLLQADVNAIHFPLECKLMEWCIPILYIPE